MSEGPCSPRTTRLIHADGATRAEAVICFGPFFFSPGQSPAGGFFSPSTTASSLFPPLISKRSGRGPSASRHSRTPPGAVERPELRPKVFKIVEPHGADLV